MIGAGVAIFHIKSRRVVLCYHPIEQYYFLPKGRRDVNETTERGAEREGFEESGFRNRLLPLHTRHRQPDPQQSKRSDETPRLNTEPVWTIFMPQSATTQYVLYWYIAETLPPDIEIELDQESNEAAKGGKAKNYFGGAGPYCCPPKFLLDTTLKERLDIEPDGYEPPQHQGTYTDEDESLYQSQLVSVEEAIRCLGPNTVMGSVVRKGWDGIQHRLEKESLYK